MLKWNGCDSTETGKGPLERFYRLACKNKEISIPPALAYKRSVNSIFIGAVNCLFFPPDSAAEVAEVDRPIFHLLNTRPTHIIT